MSFMDGLKEKVAGVLYRNLTQWKGKIGNPAIPPSELKTFIVQELSRMETELVEYNQVMLQREFNRKNGTIAPITPITPITPKEKLSHPDNPEQDALMGKLFQNNLRLLALVHVLLESPDNERTAIESSNLMESNTPLEISEKELNS